MFDLDVCKKEENMLDFGIIQSAKSGRYLNEDGWVKDKMCAIWFETEKELRQYAKKVGLDESKYLIDIVMV